MLDWIQVMFFSVSFYLTEAKILTNKMGGWINGIVGKYRTSFISNLKLTNQH